MLALLLSPNPTLIEPFSHLDLMFYTVEICNLRHIVLLGQCDSISPLLWDKVSDLERSKKDSRFVIGEHF